MAPKEQAYHLFADMLTRVQAASTAVLGPGAEIGRIVVEPPRDPTHGDMATNAAMVLAKDAGKKPRDLAESIAAKLRADEKVASVEVAGPGFINLSLKADVWGEELGEEIAVPEGLYPGDYLKPVGGELASEYGARLTALKESEWLPIVRAKAIDMMMNVIRDDLAALNVHFDVFFSERSLIEGKRDEVGATIEGLLKSGEVYEGRLPPPKGGNLEDWEDREQTLFRSTEFGDDVDRPLKKSDGSYTYFASDIAYHRSKVDRGFFNLIDVWGADHGGYIKRMQAAVNAVSAGKAKLDVKLVQLVRLLRAGEPLKMSKRAGEFVTLRGVVDEVGRDAVRFDMLYRKNDAVLDFDLAKVIEHTRENPVFYVQYGHARGQSVFRNARAEIPDLPADPGERVQWLKKAPLDRLTDSGELSILRRIALY